MRDWPVDLNVDEILRYLVALGVVEESGYTRGTPESWENGQDLLDLPEARKYPSSHVH